MSRQPETLATELFRFLTTATPESVWAALTASGRPLAYLYGMTLESDFQTSSPLSLRTPGQVALTGEVLLADSPSRLSYTIEDPPGEASLYVTWEITADPARTIIRLFLDYPQPAGRVTGDLEAAWLPVVSALQGQLPRRASNPHNPPTTGA